MNIYRLAVLCVGTSLTLLLLSPDSLAAQLTRQQAQQVVTLLNNEVDGRIVFYRSESDEPGFVTRSVIQFDVLPLKRSINPIELIKTLGSVGDSQKYGIVVLSVESDEQWAMDPEDFYILRGDRFINVINFIENSQEIDRAPNKVCYQIKEQEGFLIPIFSCT